MFLGETACIDHGVIAQTGDCCSGLTPWAYDANTGNAYDGFGCWNATCAEEGQFAPPAGSGGAGCCTGLVSVAGKCAKPPVNQPGCAAIGIAPIAGQACCTGLAKDTQGICNSSSPCAGTIICSIPDIYLYGGVGVLALLLMMGGKKR